MKKVPVTLSVALAALTLFACEKEQEQAPRVAAVSAASTLAKPALLSAGPWHQTGLTVSGTNEGSDQVATSDLFAHAKPAMLVKSAAYSADGSYSVVHGNRPDGTAAEALTGKWTLSAAADSLVLASPGSTRRLAVAELTGSTLRLTYTEPAANGKGSTYTSTFSH